MMVYLVEDSLLVRERLRDRIVEIDPDIRVFEADSAEKAVPDILDRCPDIVVLDLKLAGKSGLNVLLEVKKQEPQVNVTVFSNHSEALYRKKCLSMGANHFFDKTTDFDKVIDVIKSCMEKEEGDR